MWRFFLFSLQQVAFVCDALWQLLAKALFTFLYRVCNGKDKGRVFTYAPVCKRVPPSSGAKDNTT